MFHFTFSIPEENTGVGLALLSLIISTTVKNKLGKKKKKKKNKLAI